MTHRPVQTVAVPVADASQPGEARRAAVALAAKLGFGETARGQIALAVTEAATNLVKHAAAGGELLLRPIDCDGGVGLELLALDRGPGMAEVGRCLSDGYSTAGSAGQGLGAISRLADEFDVHSLPGSGTALLARFGTACPPESMPGGFVTGAVNLPLAGEDVCGDAWDVIETDDACRFLVVDGLGHGLHASEAAQAAVRVFRERRELGLSDLTHALHDALRSTRGAALAIAEIDRRGGLRYLGVGNIAASIHPADGGRAQSLVSQNGTVGHRLLKVTEFDYAWSDDSLLVMHSDGISTQWRLENHPGLIARHPGVIAGVLYRDYSRGRDDVTVVTARGRAQRPEERTS